MTTTDEDDGTYWDYVWEEQQERYWEQRAEIDDEEADDVEQS